MSRPGSVEWTELAVGDLEELLAFAAADDDAAAVALEDRILQATSELARHPRRGRLVPELLRIGIRDYRELVVAPYRVIYKPAADRIVVMAVLHGARDLETVLHRRLTRPGS